MKETKHDYHNCIVGNAYDSKCTGVHNSWEDFKNNFLGFTTEGYDDTYHFVFRYDIHKKSEDSYSLELCIMLQRKGIYLHLFIKNITQNQLDTEITEWLKDRGRYLKDLWTEVSN